MEDLEESNFFKDPVADGRNVAFLFKKNSFTFPDTMKPSYIETILVFNYLDIVASRLIFRRTH